MLREPLLHFLVIGALLFVLFEITKSESAPDRSVIVVTIPQQERLQADFQRVRLRLPTRAEMDGLIENYLREEVLYQEALRLGLEGNDTVIRRRLYQKMEFITASGAELTEPTDKELNDLLASMPKKYQIPGRVAFRQIFLGERPTQAEINGAIKQAQAIGQGEEYSVIGQRTLLPGELRLSNLSTVHNQFGGEFARILPTLTTNQWLGPIASAYGQHLIFLTDIEPGGMPSLEDARKALTRDWRAARVKQLQDAQYRRLRDSYQVEIEGAQSE